VADEKAQSEVVEQQAPVGDPKKPTIAMKVYAPFKVYYEGEGYSISAVNATGPFDILPKHHNFLCMLVPCNLVIEAPEGRKVIKISRALMHVKANRVVVFVDV
jgi:F0F1-type ATP synthase epsilon subunit